MIKVWVFVPYKGLTQKWSAAKINATGYHIVLDRKLFTSFGWNFNSDSSDIFFLTLTYNGGLNSQWLFSWNLLFIWRKPIIGIRLLYTGNSSTIFLYTYIFDILLIEGGNFACIYLLGSNIVNSKVWFPKVCCTINCDLKASSCSMERST